MLEEVKETVNHPDHYGGKDNPYETIKIIEVCGWLKGFCLGNAIKYITRADKKGKPKEDLEKAAWYLNWYIDRALSSTPEFNPSEFDPITSRSYTVDTSNKSGDVNI